MRNGRSTATRILIDDINITIIDNYLREKNRFKRVTRRNDKLQNEYPYVEHIIRLVHLVNECVDIDYPTNEGRRMIDCKRV